MNIRYTFLERLQYHSAFWNFESEVAYFCTASRSFFSTKLDKCGISFLIIHLRRINLRINNSKVNFKTIIYPDRFIT